MYFLPRSSSRGSDGEVVNRAGQVSVEFKRLAVDLALSRVAGRLLQRLEALEPRLDAGEEAAWVAYLETAKVLAAVLPQLEAGRRENLLTTSEMAQRIGVSPKTLLRHKAEGVIRPAVQRGKFIRWRGDEGNGSGNGAAKSSPARGLSQPVQGRTAREGRR